MNFVQQAADRGIEPLNYRQQGFDVSALIGYLGEHLRLLLGEELKSSVIAGASVMLPHP